MPQRSVNSQAKSLLVIDENVLPPRYTGTQHRHDHRLAWGKHKEPSSSLHYDLSHCQERLHQTTGLSRSCLVGDFPSSPLWHLSLAHKPRALENDLSVSLNKRTINRHES
eukprot:scpid60681/ scgid26443/ 